MTFSSCLTLIIAVSIFQTCRCQIEKTNLGVVYHPKNNTLYSNNDSVQLEAFMDLTCPDSARVYSTLLNLAERYGGKVQLKMFLFPLPFHRNSFVLSKIAKVIQKYSAPGSVDASEYAYNWFKVLFAKPMAFANSRTFEMTDREVIEQATVLAQQVCPLSGDVIKTALSSRDIEGRTRTEWKYGCTQGVYKTPTFRINDCFVEVTPDNNLAQWQQVLDETLAKATK